MIGELEILCPTCGGGGNVQEKPGHWHECEQCHGKGTVVTGMGQKVLDFVWRHFDGIAKTS